MTDYMISIDERGIHTVNWVNQKSNIHAACYQNAGPISMLLQPAYIKLVTLVIYSLIVCRLYW